MMYTEDEAKTKWCPFARVAFSWGEGGSIFDGEGATPMATTVNRGRNLSADTLCIASACMAWQWEPEDEERPLSDQRATTRGYCGLTKREIGT